MPDWAWIAIVVILALGVILTTYTIRVEQKSIRKALKKKQE